MSANALLDYLMKDKRCNTGEKPKRTGWFYNVTEDTVDYWDLDVRQGVFCLRARIARLTVQAMSTPRMKEYCEEQLKKMAGKPPMGFVEEKGRPH